VLAWFLSRHAAKFVSALALPIRPLQRFMPDFSHAIVNSAQIEQSDAEFAGSKP